MGISDYKWVFTPKGMPYTGGGFQMSALDNARWMQLYLDQGMYNGEQILPESWVQSSLSKQLATSNNKEAYYGYLFWNKTYHVDGNEIEVYYAAGNGGNRVLIFPDLSLIFVITATAYNQPDGYYQVDEMVKDYMLPAVL